MFDTLQILLWSLVYLTIIFQGAKHKAENPLLMPWVAGGLNFAWEINALILSQGFWGHLVWMGLDIFIFAHNVSILKKQKLQMLYVVFAALSFVGLLPVFRIENGMLISSFVIDLIISLEYIVVTKKISRHGKLFIAGIRLMGDLFVWLAYMHQIIFVKVIGVLILVLNLFYLCYCLEENSRKRKLG